MTIAFGAKVKGGHVETAYLKVLASRRVANRVRKKCFRHSQCERNKQEQVE